MIDSPGIVRPSAAQALDAIANDGEYRDLLAALTTAGMLLNPDAIARITLALHEATVKACPDPIPVDRALAIIGTVCANVLADVVMDIEAANPISDAGRDGRVRAVVTFVQRIIQRAVGERIMASRLDKAAAAKISKLFGGKP